MGIVDCKIHVTERNVLWVAGVTGMTEQDVREFLDDAKAKGVVCVLGANLAQVEKFERECTDPYVMESKA